MVGSTSGRKNGASREEFPISKPGTINSNKRRANGRAGSARKRPRVQQNALENDLDNISKHDYIIQGGYMYVRPYVFEFRMNYKPRWAKKTFYEVFSQEFRHAEEGYWEREFREQRVLCNGEPARMKDLWQNGDQLVHLVHRHESAVLPPGDVHIAVDHEDYVVVSKPPSYPVHPCGTYRRNSLQFILHAFYGFKDLRAIHRLDKETSGLVIMAKNSAYARKFSEDILHHKVSKTYLAEVHGYFPEGEVKCDEPLFWDKRQMKSFIRKDGASACTVFRRLKADKSCGTTLIECKPQTGRTHQIRIHLSHLGFPIVNDPLYGKNDSGIYSKSGGRRDPNKLTLHAACFNDERKVDSERTTYKACDWSIRQFSRRGNHLSYLEEGKELHCSNCPQVTNIKNVKHSVMYIHLHALKYESDNWSFEVPPPPWFEKKQERTWCTVC